MSDNRFIQVSDENGTMTVSARSIIVLYRASNGRATLKIEGVERMVYTFQQYDDIHRKLMNS